MAAGVSVGSPCSPRSSGHGGVILSPGSFGFFARVTSVPSGKSPSYAVGRGVYGDLVSRARPARTRLVNSHSIVLAETADMKPRLRSASFR